MTIYDRIKQLRIALNMSQDELARKLGYTSRSTIAKIEAGQRDLSQTKVIAFADALNTTVSYLMDGYDDDQVAKMEVIDSQIQRLYDSLPADKQKQAMDFLWFLKQGSVDKP